MPDDGVIEEQYSGDAVRLTTIRIDFEALNLVTLYICDDCMDAVGGECHAPGCAFWMNRAPDVNLWGHVVLEDGDDG